MLSSDFNNMVSVWLFWGWAAGNQQVASFQHNLTQVRVIREEEASIEKMSLEDQSNPYDIFFISDWCGRVQYIVGGVRPGLVILASLREQDEQASKQYSSMASALSPASRFQTYLSTCSDFLQWWAMILKCKPNTLILLHCFGLDVSSHQ